VGFFPQNYPGWERPTYWIIGFISSLLLFFSVLVHELAHSFVAIAKGLPVHGITLFIFGGVSNLGAETESPRDEFAIAVVGPLTSLLLSGLFLGLLQITSDAEGPLAAILSYLALINLLLGIFNLLPGYPLDGGRVLRSIVWGITKSMERATNIAAGAGQAFGWGLIIVGVFMVLGDNVFGGIWIALIGWFLMSAASSSRQEIANQKLLEGVLVSRVMQPDPETVTTQTTVEEAFLEYFLQRGLRALPVCESDRLVGIATLTDLKKVAQESWGQYQIKDIMTAAPLYSVEPDHDLSEALRVLAEHGLNQVLVLQGARLVGLLSRADIIRYLQLRQELGVRDK